MVSSSVFDCLRLFCPCPGFSSLRFCSKMPLYDVMIFAWESSAAENDTLIYAVALFILV